MVNQKGQAELDSPLASRKDSTCGRLQKVREEAIKEARENPELLLPESEKSDRQLRKDRLVDAQVKCDVIGTDSVLGKECLDRVTAAQHNEMRPLEEACLEEVKNELAAGAQPSASIANNAGDASSPERKEDRDYDYGLSQ